MSKTSQTKKDKKAARKHKQDAMSKEGYESKNNSHYAKKAKIREKNPNSPFYQG